MSYISHGGSIKYSVIIGRERKIAVEKGQAYDQHRYAQVTPGAPVGGSS